MRGPQGRRLVGPRGLRPPVLNKQTTRQHWDAATGPTRTFHEMYDKDSPHQRGMALGYLTRKKWYKYATTPMGEALLGVSCRGWSSSGIRKQDRVRTLLEHSFGLFVECSKKCSWWPGDVDRVADRRDLVPGSFCLYVGFVNALLNAKFRGRYEQILSEAQRGEDVEEAEEEAAAAAAADAARPRVSNVVEMDELPFEFAPAPAPAPAPAADLQPLSDTEDTDDDPMPTGGPSAAPPAPPAPPAPATAPAPKPVTTLGPRPNIPIPQPQFVGYRRRGTLLGAKRSPAPAPAPATPVPQPQPQPRVQPPPAPAAPRGANLTRYEKRVPDMKAKFDAAPVVANLMLFEFVRCKAEASAKRLVYNAGNRAFTAQYEKFSFVSKWRDTIKPGSTQWDAYVELKGSFQQRLRAMDRGRNRTVLRSEADINRFFAQHQDLNYTVTDTNTRRVA
jgi:hypothetical protein